MYGQSAHRKIVTGYMVAQHIIEVHPEMLRQKIQMLDVRICWIILHK